MISTIRESQLIREHAWATQLLLSSSHAKDTAQAIFFARRSREQHFGALAPKMQWMRSEWDDRSFRCEVVADAVDCRFICFYGELDVVSAEEAVSRLLDRADSMVVVDLAQLNFIDAAGLSALLRAKHEIEQAGGRLELRSAHPLVRRVFEITNLASLLD